jgi:hypothetical protein
MSDFKTTTLEQRILDPRKRVRYTTGLVLGVDEFQQEQTYLMERDRRHQRSLHGYGTVCGLNVMPRVRDGEPEILVTSGAAVDTRGRDICVPAPQCARINDWLRRNEEDVREAAGSFPDTVSLYVLLCYQECATDLVPVPGSPCRSEDDSQTAARIADDFELRLTLDLPEYPEEEAIRQFGSLLRRIRLSLSDPPTTGDELADLVRGLAAEAGGDGAPPDDDPIFLHPDDAATDLRSAFRVWTTEVRPQVQSGGCCRTPDGEPCIVLSRLDLTLRESEGALLLDDTAPGDVPGVAVDQEDRPFLLSTRLLQEWLTVLRYGYLESGSFPGSLPDDALPIALNDLLDVDTAPSPGDVLTWDDTLSMWVAAAVAGGGATLHSALGGLDGDDHDLYLPRTGVRPMTADLDMGSNWVVNLPEAEADGQAVPYEQAVKRDDAAGGDLSETYPDPRVVGLQRRAVSDAAPVLNQVLMWTGSEWGPRDVPSSSEAETNFEDDLVRIVAVSWRHGGTAPMQVDVQEDGRTRRVAGLVVVFGERSAEESDPGRVVVGRGSLDEQSFQLFMQQDGGDAGFPTYSYVGLRPEAIAPVEIRDASTPIWVVSPQVPATDPARAALLRLPGSVLESIGRLNGRQFHVVLRGDFIRDRRGRSIDAEFLRGELPTGDRPSGSRMGLQGGRFESWFTQGEGSERLNLNTARLEDLLELPGIGRALAGRIIEARDSRGGFERLEDLGEVRGISPSLIIGIRNHVRF